MFVARMEIESLLKQVINELKGMRSELVSSKVDTCGPEEALMLLGLNNRGYLKYFIEHGLLSRRKGGKSYLYFKSECTELAKKIKGKIVLVPQIREIYG